MSKQQMKLDGLMLNKKKFSKMVEDTVFGKRLSYIDAIVHLCETVNMEVEDCRKFLSPSILSKIEHEAEQLNFLPKRNSLPLE
jgi:hypothetical protein